MTSRRIAPFIPDFAERHKDKLRRSTDVAFFFPAWNEAENLPFVVAEAIAYLHDHVRHYCIIIIDDGSSDNTEEVVKNLQLTFPNRIRYIRHESNLGYGAALRTGFRAGIETGHNWIAFCDSDGQFKPHDVGALLGSALEHDAHIAIGHRIARADSLKRRLMGRGWHIVSRAALGFNALDVDCGFKVFRREALLDIEHHLAGQHATISPEILARATLANHKIVEVGIHHHERENGTQSGADFRVIVESFRDLLRLRKTIKREAKS